MTPASLSLIPWLILDGIAAWRPVSLSFSVCSSAAGLGPGSSPRTSLFEPLARDWKGSVQLDRLDAEGLDSFGRPCATTLAKAHMQFGYMVASLMVQSSMEG